MLYIRCVCASISEQTQLPYPLSITYTVIKPNIFSIHFVYYVFFKAHSHLNSWPTSIGCFYLFFIVVIQYFSDWMAEFIFQMAGYFPGFT